jgi:predicted O-methyltransferase YrrM
MSNDHALLIDDVLDYYESHAYPENPVRDACHADSLKLPDHFIQTSKAQVQFLHLLIKMQRAKKVIEVGLFSGFGTLAMAQALPDDGSIITIDISDKNLDFAQLQWADAGVEDKIRVIIDDANTALKTLLKTQAGEFDFIYIDADKQSYPSYYELALNLLKPGGTIALDNVLCFGKKVYDQNDQGEAVNVIRDLNKHIQNDTRVDMVMLPIGHGLTLARKKTEERHCERSEAI